MRYEQSYLNSRNITSLYLDNLHNPALTWGHLVNTHLEDSDVRPCEYWGKVPVSVKPFML